MSITGEITAYVHVISILETTLGNSKGLYINGTDFSEITDRKYLHFKKLKFLFCTKLLLLFMFEMAIIGLLVDRNI